MMGGHLYIVYSDLTKLACDAWLVPTDTYLTVRRKWLSGLSPVVRERLDDLRRDANERPIAWGNQGTRVIPLTGVGASQAPSPYLVNVGNRAGTPATWYAAGIEQLLERIRYDVNSDRIRLRGSRPLVAIPVVGTGQGGASDAKGSVVRAVVD